VARPRGCLGEQGRPGWARVEEWEGERDRDRGGENSVPPLARHILTTDREILLTSVCKMTF